MRRKIEIIDMGDAIKETKQAAPVGYAFDNMGVWGAWY